MLSLIPFFVMVLFLCHVYGSTAFILTKTKFQANPFLPLLFGFVVLGLLSILFLIGGPINHFPNSVIWLGAVVALWRYKFYFQIQWLNLKNWFQSLSRKFIFLLISLLVVILYQSAQPTKINDMIMYYLQTLFWMEQYGMVKGLANLHPSLGLSSAWHSLLVLLGENGVVAQVLNTKFFALNGVLLFSFILYFLAEILLEKLVLIVAFMVPIILIGFFYLTAPSPDFPILVFSMLIFYLLIKHEFGFFINRKNGDPLNEILFSLLACFIFAVKPPAFLAILSIGILCLNRFFGDVKFNWKPLIVVFFTSLLCISPLLFKNFMQTGYPIYPAGITIPERFLPNNPIELGSYTSDEKVIQRKPFWKLPKDWNESFRKGVQTWGYNDRLDKKVFKNEQPQIARRFMLWVSRSGYKGMMNRLIFANFLLGLLLFLFFIFKKMAFKEMVIISLCFFSLFIVEWYYLSQFRLMLATCLGFFAWNLFLIYQIFSVKIEKKEGRLIDNQLINMGIGMLIVFAIAAFVPFSVFKNTSRNKSITQMDGFSSKNLIFPAVNYGKSAPKTFMVDSIKFNYYADQTYASDCPIPAISLSHRKFLGATYGYRHRAFGGIYDGFYLESIANDSISIY